MRTASSGLRHPASASCLGRHSHLAGRCPNNSSLFPPLAAVVVVAAERLFLIEQCRSVCGRSGIAFSRVGSWRETAAAAPLSAKAQRGEEALPLCTLIRRYAPPSPDWGTASAAEVQFPAKTQNLRACLLPLGGAVAQQLRGYGWRSEKSVKAIAPTGAALAFLCFDFFFRIVKGVQPLTCCGVGGVQR